MASWRIRFHDKWPHLASLYASTHNLDEEGKYPDPMMGQDNIFDPAEPYGAYRYYVQPSIRSEFSIEDPIYAHRPYKDEESRSSEYTSGDSFRRGSTCRILLCVFLVLSFIAVVIAAITLAVLLSQTPRPLRSKAGPTEEFESTASIFARDYNENLANKNSAEFKELEAEFCLAIEQMFTDVDSPVKHAFEGCEVIEFRNGSVVVRYSVKLASTSPDGLKMEEQIHQKLEEHFKKKVNEVGPWQKLKFNPRFLKKFIRIEVPETTTPFITESVTTQTTAETTSLKPTTAEPSPSSVPANITATTRDLTTATSKESVATTERTTTTDYLTNATFSVATANVTMATRTSDITGAVDLTTAGNVTDFVQNITEARTTVKTSETSMYTTVSDHLETTTIAEAALLVNETELLAINETWTKTIVTDRTSPGTEKIVAQATTESFVTKPISFTTEEPLSTESSMISEEVSTAIPVGFTTQGSLTTDSSMLSEEVSATIPVGFTTQESLSTDSSMVSEGVSTTIPVGFTTQGPLSTDSSMVSDEVSTAIPAGFTTQGPLSTEASTTGDGVSTTIPDSIPDFNITSKPETTVTTRKISTVAEFSTKITDKTSATSTPFKDRTSTITVGPDTKETTTPFYEYFYYDYTTTSDGQTDQITDFPVSPTTIMTQSEMLTTLASETTFIKEDMKVTTPESTQKSTVPVKHESVPVTDTTPSAGVTEYTTLTSRHTSATVETTVSEATTIIQTNVTSKAPLISSTASKVGEETTAIGTASPGTSSISTEPVSTTVQNVTEPTTNVVKIVTEVMPRIVSKKVAMAPTETSAPTGVQEISTAKTGTTVGDTGVGTTVSHEALTNVTAKHSTAVTISPELSTQTEVLLNATSSGIAFTSTVVASTTADLQDSTFEPVTTETALRVLREGTTGSVETSASPAPEEVTTFMRTLQPEPVTQELLSKEEGTRSSQPYTQETITAKVTSPVPTTKRSITSEVTEESLATAPPQMTASKSRVESTTEETVLTTTRADTTDTNVIDSTDYYYYYEETTTTKPVTTKLSETKLTESSSATGQASTSEAVTTEAPFVTTGQALATEGSTLAQASKDTPVQSSPAGEFASTAKLDMFTTVVSDKTSLASLTETSSKSSSVTTSVREFFSEVSTESATDAPAAESTTVADARALQTTIVGDETTPVQGVGSVSTEQALLENLTTSFSHQTTEASVISQVARNEITTQSLSSRSAMTSDKTTMVMPVTARDKTKTSDSVTQVSLTTETVEEVTKLLRERNVTDSAMDLREVTSISTASTMTASAENATGRSVVILTTEPRLIENMTGASSMEENQTATLTETTTSKTAEAHFLDEYAEAAFIDEYVPSNQTRTEETSVIASTNETKTFVPTTMLPVATTEAPFVDANVTSEEAPMNLTVVKASTSTGSMSETIEDVRNKTLTSVTSTFDNVTTKEAITTESVANKGTQPTPTPTSPEQSTVIITESTVQTDSTFEMTTQAANMTETPVITSTAPASTVMSSRDNITASPSMSTSTAETSKTSVTQTKVRRPIPTMTLEELKAYAEQQDYTGATTASPKSNTTEHQTKPINETDMVSKVSKQVTEVPIVGTKEDLLTTAEKVSTLVTSSQVPETTSTPVEASTGTVVNATQSTNAPVPDTEYYYYNTSDYYYPDYYYYNVTSEAPLTTSNQTPAPNKTETATVTVTEQTADLNTGVSDITTEATTDSPYFSTSEGVMSTELVP